MPPEFNETFFGAAERSTSAEIPSSSLAANAAVMETYYEYVKLLARMSAWRCFQIKLDPEDLAQEAMLRVRAKWSQLRSSEPAAIKSWLKEVVLNLLRDLIRKAHADIRDIANEVSLEAALDQSSARLEAFLPANASTPSKAAVRNERILALIQALGRLPADQRLAIELHHLSGFSLDETAQRMDRSFTSVAGLLRRGLKTLRVHCAALETRTGQKTNTKGLQ